MQGYKQPVLLILFNLFARYFEAQKFSKLVLFSIISGTFKLNNKY